MEGCLKVLTLVSSMPARLDQSMSPTVVLASQRSKSPRLYMHPMPCLTKNRRLLILSMALISKPIAVSPPCVRSFSSIGIW